MSNPRDVELPDAQRILDHCMSTIKGASAAIAEDMHDAAMKLGTAEMMLASASHLVHQYDALLTPAEPGT